MQRRTIPLNRIDFIMQGRTWSKISGIATPVRPCQRCEEPNVGGLYRECLKCRNAKRTKKAKAKGLCSCCKTHPTKKGRKQCELCLNYQVERRARTKRAVLKGYGGKCICCGESNIGFLTIDHVNNDGAEHRKEMGPSSNKLYQWLIRNDFPDGFQVLCFNCNCGRAHNGGICPHKDVH